jgi:hypothetical protein
MDLTTLKSKLDELRGAPGATVKVRLTNTGASYDIDAVTLIGASAGDGFFIDIDTS